MRRQTLLTATAIHYKGDIPSVIRYVQGPYTSAHWDRPAALQFVKDKIDNEIYQDFERVLNDGYLAYCNAHSTEQN